jgi:hypothetical protein
MSKETRTEASAVAYRYVADPAHGMSFPGVPPRDLTQDEFDALSDENKENVTKSGLYEEEGNARSKK